MNAQTVSAVFDSHAQAESAIASLRAAGISDAALSVIGRDEVAHDGHSDSLVTGGLADDTVESKPVARGLIGGAALGTLLGVAALAIPGVGPFVAAGAIASSAVPGAMATGALIGAAAGGLREALTHHGIHEADATYYEQQLDQGGILVMVNAAEAGVSEAEIADLLARAGGRTSSTATAATTAMADTTI